MFSPIISIIVAMDTGRGIGKSNGMMWKIPEEQQKFKEITMGHPMVMGRITYESIGKPLKGRTSIVITRNQNFAKSHPELIGSHKIVNSLEEALDYAKTSPGGEEIFIIGGGQIYNQALNLADKIYLTIVEGDFKADVFFPDYTQLFRVISESKLQESNAYKYKFFELRKK